MDTEEIVAKVLALYESDLLYEIIDYYGQKNDTGKFVSIDIDGINEILEAYNFLNQKGGDEKPIKAIDDIISRDGFNYFICKQSFCYATDIIKISNSDNRNCLNGLKLLKKSLTDIQFEFHPKDEAVFKRLFILVGQANRYFYLNGKDKPVKNIWTMRSFSMDSNLKACIFSSTCYRENLSKGINKIKLEIPFCEKYENYSLDQVNNEIDDIRQNIFEEKQKRIYQGFNFEIDRITKNNEELTPHSISTSMEKEQQNSTSQTLTIEEEYKIGCEFYKEGLYEKAFKHFSNLAEQGYSLAQKSLADMYFKGEGTEKDLAKSLEWYEKAAEQGNDNAQFSLGLFFFCGNGVTQDYAEAKNWFEKASAQNNSSASYFLSCMYYNGDGIEKDRQKAQWLFKKARETCNEQEIMELDKLYYKYRCKNATLNIPVEAQNNDLPKKKKVVIIKKKKVL